MARYSRFYLGRVIKLGEATSELLMRVVESAPVISVRGARYTFTDFKAFGDPRKPNGIFGRLTKYRPEGSVDVLKHDVHRVGSELVPDLIEASSEFVYIPEFSGIAYRHVWNSIQREVFERTFSQLFDSSELAFMARCEIRPLVDMRAFASRLANVDLITELRATVNPPNPLLAPCWESLFNYVKKRRIEELVVVEKSHDGIQSRLQEVASKVAAPARDAEESRRLMEPLMGGIGDAAVLMAADGYGSAKIAGLEDGKRVVFKTSDNQKSFEMPAVVAPEELYSTAYDELKIVGGDRWMEHG